MIKLSFGKRGLETSTFLRMKAFFKINDKKTKKVLAFLKKRGIIINVVCLNSMFRTKIKKDTFTSSFYNIYSAIAKR